MTRISMRIAMMSFIAVVVVAGFFGPYLLSLLLLGVGGLCWAFPRRSDEEDSRHSSGASTIGS